MNVTKDNFEQLLPQVIKDIKACDFIGIDCEFTGLVKDRRDRIDIMDSAADRFQKVSSSVRSFLPIQVGICTFQYKPDGFYEAKPYNFYVFPKSGNRYFGLERVFSTQVGSLEFLLGNNFDFMKWVY
jgi:poly(A)-specific ribonuclease